ncbi:LCP family glycopolymer transferase [Halobacillus mangrovi]|uniref:Transcriptional regulator LytR n=1 Tax=Halobacillus mangrovi TaxID=402384 RepID=A0A1W5ZSJ3_9BACI|nr:LCP family protein [Halobacillus mangrovi]ARI76264.1 transcriptional regulator LytR [Halobacillus mangrovi]
MSRLSKHKKKKGKWWKIPLLLLTLIILAGGIYVYTVYSGAKSTVDEKMHKQVASINHELTEKKMEEQKSLNILLMGVDERSYDSGRSDALMVLTLDPSNNRSQLVSIPRDTRTEMVGNAPQSGSLDKINHAYAFGGADMAINTVENFLDIELDYYVKVNMEGLADLVNSVGGVTVQNSIDWVGTNGYHYKKGQLTLNGSQALRYVRMRYEDPKGDLGRNERQRQIIKAIVDKGASVGSVNKIGDVMDVLGNNVTTNMDFNTMKDLMLNYRSAQKDMTTYQMTGSGTKINGIYYLQVSDQEIQEVHNMIKEYSS